jgi:hypothetical protein
MLAEMFCGTISNFAGAIKGSETPAVLLIKLTRICD